MLQKINLAYRSQVSATDLLDCNVCQKETSMYSNIKIKKATNTKIFDNIRTILNS